MEAPKDTKILLDLIEYTEEALLDNPGTILVHCSAGVGRTGTFICVDQIINNIDTSPCSDVDIFHTVYKLRRQR